MPIYEYRCNECLEDFEALVTSNTVVKCPKCESDDIKKKFSLFATKGMEKQVSSGCSSCSSASCSTCK